MRANGLASFFTYFKQVRSVDNQPNLNADRIRKFGVPLLWITHNYNGNDAFEILSLLPFAKVAFIRLVYIFEIYSIICREEK